VHHSQGYWAVFTAAFARKAEQMSFILRSHRSTGVTMCSRGRWLRGLRHPPDGLADGIACRRADAQTMGQLHDEQR
jgi:hypothetical protein